MPSDASDLEFSLTKSYQGGRPSSMTIHERQESVEENPNQGNQYTYIVITTTKEKTMKNSRETTQNLIGRSLKKTRAKSICLHTYT
jgi:hypothetical protein